MPSNKSGWFTGQRSILAMLFVAVTSACMLLSSGVLESQDGWLYLSVARNVYYNHTTDAAPDEYPLKNVHFNTSKTADGRWKAPGSLGYSLAMVPAVALTDLVYRIYNVAPPVHFPLEHDWLLHLFASMTNSVIIGVFAVVMVSFLHSVTKNFRYAVVMGIATIATTNLLPLAKFSFPHMLFITAMMSMFLFARRWCLRPHPMFILGGILSLIVLAASYNTSYLLPLLPCAVYVLMLSRGVIRRTVVLLIGIALLGLLIVTGKYIFSLIPNLMVYPKVLFEGVWGFLFSPGKSIFLYSPPLLLLPLFWHKLPKKYLPEYVAGILLLLLYLYVFGSAWIPYSGGMQAPIWYGGMVWGPRYLSPVIPLGMVAVAVLLPKLQKTQRIWIALPLFVGGIIVQVIGVSVPYLVQYRDITANVFVGRHELSVYDYASFMPRFSPLLSMSRELVDRVRSFPSTVRHGTYNVRFIDGFSMPTITGIGPMRNFDERGYLLFSTDRQTPSSLYLSFFNAPLTPESTYAAKISINLASKQLAQIDVPGNGHQELTLDLRTVPLQPHDNLLSLHVSYPATTSALQRLYLKQMVFDHENVNLRSLDYPDLSAINTRFQPHPYYYYGAVVTDPWKHWHMRARITEQTFDFWWIRNLYYWDRPQQALWIAFGGLTAISLGSWGLLCWMTRKHQT